MTELTKQQMQAIALANARRRASEAQAYDAQGFPQEPTGGSSTNSQAVSELGSGLEAAFQGVHNGAFLGFGDNVNGAMGALIGASPTNPGEYFGGMGDRYARERDNYRKIYAQNEASHPAEMMAGNIGGGVIPAALSAPYATGKTLLGTIARGVGIGAGEGAVAGAGYADGQDVLPAMGRGALIGGALGGAAPAVIAAVRGGLIDPLTGGVDALINRANQGKASRAIGGALRSSGKTQADVAADLARAAMQGQPEFRLMDAMGLPGQRQASGMARSGGDAGTEIADFLMSRQAGQGERVGAFVDDAFATKGTTAAKTTEALTKARGDAANTAYDAARGNAAPVDVRGALGVIDKRIGGMQGSGVTGDAIDSKLAGYRARLAGDGKGLGPGVTGAELSDFDRVLGVKQAVQDDIGAAIRAGRNNEARELGKLVTELDAALEGSSDMYRTANDQFRDASRVIGAVDEGAMMANRGRAADNVPAFQQMNADMQGAARVGYGDSLLAALERNASQTSNKAKPLINSPKRVAEAEAIALQPDVYAERLGRENTMWETQNRALGGSRTADNQQDIAGLTGGALGAVRSAASMNIGDAVSKIAGILGPIAKTQNPATRSLIVKALMSNDAAVLIPMIKREATGQGASRIIEALLRNGMQLGSGTR